MLKGMFRFSLFVVIVVVGIKTVFASSGSGQIAFYDAQKLRNFVVCDVGNKTCVFDAHVKTLDSVCAILKEYTGDSTLKSISEVLEHYRRTDPNFIGCFIPGKTETDVPLTVTRVLRTPSSLASLDVANISQGIALFMIERAREELNISFFQHLNDFFIEYPEVRLLFPKTSEALKSLISYRYTEMLPVLRLSFFDDLQSWPQHLDEVFAVPRYAELTKKYPELRLVAQAIQLADLFRRDSLQPYDLLERFSGLKAWTDSSSTAFMKNVGNGLALANIFCQSLRDNGQSSTAWITPAELKKLIGDSITFRLYIGLIYQQVKVKTIQFLISKNHEAFDTTKFCAIMDKYKDNTLQLQRTVELLIENSNRFMMAYNSINAEKKAGSPIPDDEYCRFVATGIDLVEQYMEVTGQLIDNKDYQDCLLILYNCLNSFKYLSQKNYGAAIFAGTNAMSEAVTEIEKRKKCGEKFPDDFTRLSKLVSKVSCYGVFMANIVDSKTPEDVKNAIEAAALPVGGSAIKKNSSIDVCVQGYLGAYFGIQKWDNADNSWKTPYGVIAPIGISISTGMGKAGAISLFGSLIDIGAIVDYDLKTERSPTDSSITTIRKDYKVQLGDIFSPGAYLIYGCFGNFPLSVGVGAQFGPGFSSISGNGATVVDNPAWRYNVFVGVDIPFMEIANSPRVR